MKYFLSSLLFFIATGVSAETVAKPNLIVSNEPFSANGKVEDVSTAFASHKEVTKKESGEVNGVVYSFYYTDGSGTFAGKQGNKGTYEDPRNTNWEVRCEKDAVTDRKHCSMKMKDLWIFVYPKGAVTVSIGHDHYPGSSVTIRIDREKPLTVAARSDGDFNSQTSRRLVQQLSKASLVTTRYMEWPYRHWQDETWELFGFNEALSYLTWAVERIR